MDRPVSSVLDSRSAVALFDAGRAVGAQDGYRRGHVAGYDVGYAQGRADLATEIEAADSAERDAANRALVAETVSRPSMDELRRRRSREPLPPWDPAAEVARCRESWEVGA